MSTSIEQNIKDCIQKQLEEGIVEKVITKQFEKCLESSIESLFSYGAIRDVVKDQLKQTLVPFLENYDYSECVVKLDHVLKETLATSFSDNNKLVKNISELLKKDDVEVVKMSDIFTAYNEYCANTIDHDKIDIDYEGGYVNTCLNVDEVHSTWSSFERHIVSLTCEEDSELNIEFEINRFKDSRSDKYDVSFRGPREITAIRHMSSIEILLLKLSQSYNNVELDTTAESEEIFVEYQE